MQGQFRSPPLTETNKWLIIVSVSVFILNTLASVYGGVNFAQILGLSVSGFLGGKIYQIVTFPFVHMGLINILFNCLILWFIGCDLEMQWGKTFYRKFLGLSVLVSAVSFIIIGYFALGPSNQSIFSGLQGANLALLVAFGMIYAEKEMLFMFLFPIKAKYFALLLAAIELYGAVMSPHSATAWGHLVCMAFSFLYLKSKSQKSQGGSIFSSLKKKKKTKKSHLSIVKDEDSTTFH